MYQYNLKISRIDTFFLYYSNIKYYIIPFFKTNLTDGEVEGPVKTYKAS